MGQTVTFSEPSPKQAFCTRRIRLLALMAQLLIRHLQPEQASAVLSSAHVPGAAMGLQVLLWLPCVTGLWAVTLPAPMWHLQQRCGKTARCGRWHRSLCWGPRSICSLNKGLWSSWCSGGHPFVLLKLPAALSPLQPGIPAPCSLPWGMCAEQGNKILRELLVNTKAAI